MRSLLADTLPQFSLNLVDVITSYTASITYSRLFSIHFHKEGSHRWNRSENPFIPEIAKITPSGLIWASDETRLRILSLSENKKKLKLLHEVINEETEDYQPIKFAFDTSNDKAFVLVNKRQVRVFDINNFKPLYTFPLEAEYSTSIDTDNKGQVFVLNQRKNFKTPFVSVYSHEGSFIRKWEVIVGPVVIFCSHTNYFGNIAVNKITGEVFVVIRINKPGWFSDSREDRLYVFDSHGNFLRNLFRIEKDPLSIEEITIDNHGQLILVQEESLGFKIFACTGICYDTVKSIDRNRFLATCRTISVFAGPDDIIYSVDLLITQGTRGSGGVWSILNGFQRNIFE